jgi:hypothetical protein
LLSSNSCAVRLCPLPDPAVRRYVTAVTPDGLDLYFLNRGVVKGNQLHCCIASTFLKTPLTTDRKRLWRSGVKSAAGLQDIFSTQPTGGTPLNGALNRIYSEYAQLPAGRKYLLIVVVTDGVPSDGTKDKLAATIRAKPSFAHVSFAECTDRPEVTCHGWGVWGGGALTFLSGFLPFFENVVNRIWNGWMNLIKIFLTSTTLTTV